MSFVSYIIDELMDFGQCHPVHGFGRCTWSKRAAIGVELVIGAQVEVGNEQHAVEVADW